MEVHTVITIEEMEDMLDEIADEFPEELFHDLNGGIILLPEEKANPAGKNLYILGEYNRGGNLGRYISIYYGSFMKLFGFLSKDQLKEKLVQVLKHEFTHHVESLAGAKDLEIKDEENIAIYLHNNKDNII